MRRGSGAALLLVRAAMTTKAAEGADYSPLHRLALDVHRALSAAPIGVCDSTVVVLVGEESVLATSAQRLLSAAPSPPWVAGQWELKGEAANAGREVELALEAAAEYTLGVGAAPDGEQAVYPAIERTVRVANKSHLPRRPSLVINEGTVFVAPSRLASTTCGFAGRAAAADDRKGMTLGTTVAVEGRP